MSDMQSTRPSAIGSLGMVTLVVENQNDSLEWYRDVLGFEVVTDESFEMGEATSRWLTVAPPDSEGPEISLVPVDDPMYQDQDQFPLESRLGANTLWMFNTEDIDAAVASLEENDVDVDEIMETPWGRLVVFRDIDGNAFQLFENPDPAA